jgi:O-antigen ligase
LESIGQIGEDGVANDITSGRLALWTKAIQLFLQKPVFGIGWQQFAAQDKYNHNVHNTYLQWLCETGVVGFVLIFVPIFVMAVLTLQQAYKLSCQRADAKIRMINFVSLGMQAFLAICNLVDPAFYHLNYFCFYSFTMILAHYAYHTGKQELQLLNKENEQ